MKTLRVGYVCMARLSFDCEYAEAYRKQTIEMLSGMGVELVYDDQLTITEDDVERVAEKFLDGKVDVMLVQYGTFSLGTLMPLLADRVDASVILWGIPEPSLGGGKLRLNSFCGVNMNAHALMRMERKYEYVFGSTEDAKEDIDRLFRVFNCIKNLHYTRLGLIGYRVPGFYTSNCDELPLRRTTGVEVEHVALSDVYQGAEKFREDKAAIAAECEKIRAESASCEITDEEVEKAAALHLAIKAIAEERKLGAISLKCWPELMSSYGIAPCSTIGRLNADGIITACEGDVYGGVTMLMQKFLSGDTPFFADFVYMDDSDNTGIAWHCGAAPVGLAGKAEDVGLCKHTVAGGGGKIGVTGEFPIKAQGPVTMARFGMGRDGYRLFFAAGEAVDKGKILRGNPLCIKFNTPIMELGRTIVEEGLEHHFSVVHADLRREMRLVAKWMDLDVVDPEA